MSHSQLKLIPINAILDVKDRRGERERGKVRKESKRRRSSDEA